MFTFGEFTAIHCIYKFVLNIEAKLFTKRNLKSVLSFMSGFTLNVLASYDNL